MAGCRVPAGSGGCSV